MSGGLASDINLRSDPAELFGSNEVVVRQGTTDAVADEGELN